MINKYYIKELKKLREIASEFAKENPALAPMLGEPSADPDVERLLEGVAFLTAMVRQKIDDEIPEIIHDVLRQTWPQFLRPIPACTLMAVTPYEELTQSLTVPGGTVVNSIPVKGTACSFRTCYDVDVLPLMIRDVSYRELPGDDPAIRLHFALTHGPAADFRPKRLRLYLDGNYGRASDLYHILLTGLTEIRISADANERPYCLSPSFLNPAGFSYEEALIPWPREMFDGYRLVLEYFLMPEKFLFIDITGLDQWDTTSLSETFHVDLVLKHRWPDGVKPDKGNFRLSVVPAINLFSHDAAPITVDHTRDEYKVRPQGECPDHYQVFSIEHVHGQMKGLKESVAFEPFHTFSIKRSHYVYHEHVMKNPVRDAVDVSVSVPCPPGMDVSEKIRMSVETLCTNGFLTEDLMTGDIRFVTMGASEYMGIENIRKPTTACLPPLGSDTLWRLKALMTLSHLTLTHTHNLQSNLSLLLPEGVRDKMNRDINDWKIQGIVEIQSHPADRLINGLMYRGFDIRMTAAKNHFAGQGDLYLFGSVLDRFFSMYASINTFTRLVMNEKDSKETYSWPERLGTQLSL